MADMTIDVALKGNTKQLTKDIQKALKDPFKVFIEKASGGAGSFAGGVRAGVLGGEAPGGAAGGIGKMIGSLGLVVGVLGVIQDKIGKVYRKLSEASGQLRGTNLLFKKAEMLFFKPFGDALSAWLRPMAKGILKYTKWWSKNGEGIIEAMKLAMGLVANPIKALMDFLGLEPGDLGPKIMDKIISWFANIDWEGTWETIKEKLSMAGEWLWTTITETLATAWEALADIGSAIYEQLVEALGPAWEKLKEIGKWLFEHLTLTAKWGWEKLKEVGTWLYDHLTGTAKWGWDKLKDIGGWLYEQISGLINKAIAWAWEQIQKLNPFGKGDDDGGSTSTPVKQDFIMRPGQPAVSFSGSDTLVGFKGSSPKGMGSGGGSFSPRISIHIDNVGSDVDIERMATIIQDRIRDSFTRRSAYA